jgi:hypothetical protein
MSLGHPNIILALIVGEWHPVLIIKRNNHLDNLLIAPAMRWILFALIGLAVL